MRLVSRIVICGILCVVTLALPALAQEQPTTRVFRLEYIQPSSLETTLQLFPARVQANNNLGTLTVSATPEIMAAIEDVISDLDTLKVERAIELTIHILTASNEPGTSNVPGTLAPVIEQLRRVFSYQTYAVLDTVTLRALDGHDAQTAGTLSLPPFGQNPSQPTFYNFDASLKLVMPEPDRTVLQLTGMRTGFRVPVATGKADGNVSYQYVDVGFNADLDIPEGQQIVVGKATVGDKAMILVMSAEVLD